jgi:transmembrane sensor
LTEIIDEKNSPAREQALDWLLRIHADPDDPALRTGLAEWLARDDENAKAYRKAERVWNVMGRLPATHAEAWQENESPAANPTAYDLKASQSRRSKSPRTIILAVGSLAAALLLIFLPTLRLQLQSDHRTGTAERREVTLADGSVMFLNADSAVAVNYTATQRKITLLEGEAFFEVAADRHRPFSVQAKGMLIQDIGTAFDVSIGSNMLAVDVQSGIVTVNHENTGQSVETSLATGDRLKIDRTNGRAVKDSFPHEQIGAWRKAELVVYGATIRQVIEEIERYHDGLILVLDKEWANRKITGVYDLRDPGAALRAAVKPHAGVVRQLTPYLLVASAR